jgi:hypothetical protein
MNIIQQYDGRLSIIDSGNLKLGPVTRFVSEEQYMITDDYTGTHKELLKGKVLRLVSGVDFSEVPGYHYRLNWTTVVPEGGMPKFGSCGIERKYLKLVD